MKSIFKKTISLFLIVTFISSACFIGIFSLPEKAKAAWPVGTIVDIPKIINDTMLSVLKPILLGMARQLALALLSGQSDMPIFFSNFEDYLPRILKRVANKVIDEIFAGNMCRHIARSILEASLRKKYLTEKFECKLDFNFEGVAYGKGKDLNYTSLNHIPFEGVAYGKGKDLNYITLNHISDIASLNNNDFAVYLQVDDAITDAQAKAEKSLETELAYGDGIMPVKDCKPKGNGTGMECETVIPSSLVANYIKEYETAFLNAASAATDPTSLSSLITDAVQVFLKTLKGELQRQLSEKAKELFHEINL